MTNLKNFSAHALLTSALLASTSSFYSLTDANSKRAAKTDVLKPLDDVLIEHFGVSGNFVLGQDILFSKTRSGFSISIAEESIADIFEHGNVETIDDAALIMKLDGGHYSVTVSKDAFLSAVADSVKARGDVDAGRKLNVLMKDGLWEATVRGLVMVSAASMKTVEQMTARATRIEREKTAHAGNGAAHAGAEQQNA